jgi:ribonucleoside-diphosphate reductase alpha chain
MNVTKRDGSLEPINLEKIHQVLEWAAEGLEVSISEIELKAHIQFYEGMTTEEIHKLLIKSAADLIEISNPDYQTLSARLLNFSLRKTVYGNHEPAKLSVYVNYMCSRELYTNELCKNYSPDDMDTLDARIVHSRDYSFVYAAMKQWEGKYLVQNRVTKQVYETPQMAYMAIAMTLFMHYSKSTRLIYVANFYDAISLGKISLPTPIMGGLRTPTKQFSSCVLIETDDSLDSINGASSAIVKYISQRAGIGLNFGRLRPLGSGIRNSEAVHTGVIPFLKHFQSAVKSCSQGAIRGGAATAYVPFWHKEINEIIVLKNNRGVEENRVRHLDYGIQLNGVFYKRAIEGKDVTLFSVTDAPELYNAFVSIDPTEFERVYINYESTIPHLGVKIPALSLLIDIIKERAQTGRIYIQNIDHCNTHSSFSEPITMSNLCTEITLPTSPLDATDLSKGEIALCTLAAFNLGAVTIEELPEVADLAVRALDAILDYQDYPMEAALPSKGRRSLGIGVTNFAYWLAKQGLTYSDNKAIGATHELMEAVQHSLLTASCNLAKEKGPCNLYDRTKYSKGILPIDTYKPFVNTIYANNLKYDWVTLRKDIAKYGLRNSTVSAQMPCETSSQITNSTNGIEPPRDLVSVKGSKEGTFKQVVPGVSDGLYYETLWNMPNNTGYLNIVAIMQKFIDQSISANTNYNPIKYPEGRVPIDVLLEDIIYAYKVGVKTLYYHNTKDIASDDDGCSSGACKL